MKRLALTVALMLTATLSHAFKIIHGPYLQNLEQNEVTVVWITDKPSIGWLELAPDGDETFYATKRDQFFDTTSGVKTTTTIHKVRLRGLAAGTPYRYRVCAQEVTGHEGVKVYYGDMVSTNVYTKKPLRFKTADPDSGHIRFAVLNDIHGDNERLRKLIGQADPKKTDLFIFNGDMVSISGDQEQVFSGYMDTAVELFASETPMYYTRGNHETRGTFATRFHDYFSPTKDELYYTFRQGPVFFVVLDTGEDKPDSDVEYYGITDYDNYRSAQADWLRTVLESEEYNKAPYKVVIAHIPPIVDWHGNNEVLRKFVPLLNQHKPDMMFCGHEHRFYDLQPDQDRQFPLLINAHTSVIKVEADTKAMQIQVVDMDGKAVGQKTLTRK